MSQQVADGTFDRGTRGVLRQRPSRPAITARGLLSLPVLLALALSSLVVIVAAPQPATAAEVFTVNTLSDNVAPLDGGSCGIGGSCSLRGAILEANVTPGTDTIRFEIGGGAPFVIAPGSPLPAVTETVIIQGRNQAIGPDVNTPIRLDGVGAGASATGLDLSGSTGSEVSGLSIGRFEVGILAGSNATIRGNFIGTDQVGAAGFGNGYGVRIQNASNVVVGGTTVGGADRNVVASNFVGVHITSNSDDNRILGNYIGTDPLGTAPLGNDFGISIQPFDASDTEPSERNLIGDGTGLGRNVISGNGREGIQLWDNAVGTVIRDNFIGVVGSVGQFPLGNNQSGPDTGAVGGVGGFNWGGIVLRNGASDNVIGGPGPGDANTIANNNNGVVAFSGTGNTITNNSMSANLDRGIVLFDAAVNDPGDLDGGANLGQNQPVLTSASIEAPNQLTVELSVDTINPGSGVYPIVVDFYEADSGATGQGQRTLQGRFSIDDPGTYSTIIGFAGTQIEVGDPIVAIATDAAGNSSTFSHVAVVGGGDALASSEAGERFGASVALDGDRMAVSAPFADVAGVNGGVVRVYDRTDEAGPWVLTGVIATPNPEVDGGFGDALDLRGDLIAVGESDRFGDEGEAGVVWVFSFNGITWDPVGEAIEQPSPTAGDRFGTDLAWIDDTNLAIGAPGVAADSGSVFVAALTGGTWSSTDLSAPLPVGVQPAAGAEFGFSIAYDDSADGIGALIVGAPRSDNTDPARIDDGSIYRFERSGGSFNWTNRASGFGNDTRMGSSAAISGNRYVAGGFGTGNLQVVAREFDGAWQELAGGFFAGGVPTAGDGPVNDYLAIDGRTIAIGRGGGGGSVELFTIGDTWPSGPPTVIAPSEREAGDRIGWSLDLDGRTLLAGAPGDDGTSNAALDAGAVYSFEVPIVSTWTGASPAATNLWSDPQNWALGAVPEPGGAVIVPSGEVVDVDVDVELARFVMESGSFVGVGDERVFTSSNTTLLGSSELVAQPGGEIVFRNRAEIDSFFIARNGNFSELPNGVLTLDGDVVVTGTGEIDVPGTVRKTGAGTATVDVLDFPTPLSGWLSSSGSQIEVAEGVLELDGADLDNGELVGEVFVAAGAQFRVNGNVILTPSTSIGVEIDGNATTTDNYGRIDITGTLNKAGELFVNETDLVVGNAYPVISCDDCLPGDFFSVPDGIDIQVDSQVISVSANPCDTEWTGAAGNGFWLTAANWTNGVPTAGDVACLNGTGDVTIGEDTSAAVDRFEIADQRIIIDGTLDVNNTSFMNEGVEVNGILTAIGDVVLRGDSVVSGFLDGLVSVENGATLELAGGASIIATAPVNDFINDGTISVTATDLLLGNGVNVFNNGVWAWTADQPQRVVTSGTATIVNPAQIELSDQPVDLGPGIALEFGGGSVLTTSILSSSAAGQFGSLAAEGTVTVTPGAALIVELDPGYSPTIFDRYEILDCGADACDSFTNTTLPSELEQSIVGGDIVLGLAAANPTFIDNTGDGLWGTAENWTTGLVPGANDIAEIPAGVTARVTGVFDVGAVDVDGQLDVGEFDTLTITGGVGGALVSSIRSGGSVTVVSPDTLNIAAASVVVESGGEFAIGTGARVVFNGTAPQTVTGGGEFRNEGIVRIENPSQVTIAETLDYFDGDDSSIEAAAGEFWFGPTNLGVTDVDIEAGASFEFTSTSAFAGGNFEVRGALDSDSLDVSGIVQVRTGGVFTPDGVLDVTGGQVFTSEAAPGGIVRLLDGSEITGVGLLANSGEISVTGAVTVGSGVDWNNGRNGLLDVDGALDVQTTQYEAEGSVDVAAGSTITFAGNTILRPSSSLTFGVISDGIAGTIDTQLLGFEPYGALDEDQSLATIVLDLDEGFSETGPITIIDCVNCAADPPGVANGVEFDEFVTGDYDVIVGRETVDVAILENKIVGPAPGEGFFSDRAFGAALAVDGDWAVVGAPTDASNFYVLRRVDGIGWEIAQSIETERFLDGSSVAIGGDHLAIGSPTGTDVYRLNGAGDAFQSIDFLEGEVLDLDIDGDKLVVGSFDEDRVVTILQLSPFSAPSVLGTIESPSIAVSRFAESVAVDDRRDGSSTVIVGARAGGDDESEVGVVYVYEAADADWITDPAPLVRLDAPEGGEEFGSSLGVSDGVVVVGDPFNDTPAGDQGAVWVYDETASFAAAPIKLLASDGTSSDTFGIAVDVDGGAIVAGAGAAQKFGFPLRDGAAYVFQFDGIDWVETDQLRAPDGFDQERFGDAVAVSGTDVLVGARRDRNSNGFDAGAVYAFEFEAVEPADTTTLELALSSGSPGAESVVGSISIAELDRVASAGVNAGSTLAAASLADIAGDDPQATALSEISLGATPLTSIVIDSDELSAIPLVNISIDGGWGDIIAGSELENEPFASLTFGQVVRAAGVGNSPQAPAPDSPAGQLAQTPLTSIEVDGTPLTSIPLGAIALGETPLTSIDGPDWCAIVIELFPDRASCEAALPELTLFEVTLRGVPLTSIPLTSIPLTSIDLAESPLTSIPLTSIDLGATPLTSIPLTSIDVAGSPLTSIPLTSIPLTSIPLTSIPLTSIPLTSIPLTSIPLTSIATSIPLTSIPLTSIGPSGTPLTSIQLQGAPLTSIPLTSIVLADTPLTSIPLTSIGDNGDAWCEVLAAAGTGFDCTSGADPATTTLRDLSVRGVPLTSIPLTSIPLTSIDVAGSPLTSIPLTSIPLTSIPLTSIPLTSIPLTSIDLAGAPLTSIPLTSIPLTSIDVGSTPLTSIPLTSIPLTSIPLTSIPLTSIPLTSIPLTSIPLTSIRLQGAPLTSIPLTSIDIADTPLTSIPLTSIPLTSIDCRAVDCSRDSLGDAARAGAISDQMTLADIRSATSGIRLGEIVDALTGVDRDEISDALGAEGLTLADLEGLDDLQLGELPLDLLGGVTLGDLGAALASVTFGDLVGAIVDPATGQPFPQFEEDLRTGIASEANTLGDLDSLGDVTLGDLLDGGTAELTLADIEPVLGFITVQTFVDAGVIDLDQIDFGTARLGDLTPDQLGQLTLGDVLAQAGGDLGPLLDALDAELANYTLGDLLLALVDPGSLSLGGVDFPDVAAATLPDGTSPTTSFVARFTATGDGPQLVEIRAELPAGASLRPGTARVVEDPDVMGPRIEAPLEPAVSGSSLTWTVTATPGVPYAIEFDVTLGLRLGVASLTSSAQVLGTDVVRTASTELSIIEGAENNDFPQVTPAAEGFVYLTYIASSTDNDVYSIELEENDRLFVELSNLDADLDVALYADPRDVLSGSPLTGGVSSDAPLNAITDPDADGADAEPLDDFRRLDQVDPDLELVAVSNQPGDENEGLATGRLAAGTYYIQVYGANGATNLRPAALQLQVAEADDAPVCRPVGVLPSAAFGTLPTIGSDVNTLILVNESRLEQFYGTGARSDVSASLAGLTGFLAGDPTIVPAVVPVDGSPAVRAAYQAWDTDGSCDPELVNNVVRTINDEIIDDVRDQLEHVVILGGDEIIPMARLVDSTTVANEYDFRNEFDGDLVGDTDAERNGRNALTSSFWESRILSDEPYGDADARSLGNRYLYVTDIALGRVVETPEDIVDALDTFVEFDGDLAIDTATVLGYDFLVDGSEAVADALVDGLGDPGLVDAALADGIDDTGELWDRVDAADKLVEAGANSLVSLNAHFDHYRALPAIGDKVPGFEDNLIAEAVAEELSERLGDRALLNSLIFSMGCHSGLSVSDVTIAGTNTDWAETLGQQGALYVGNTGFGYGDTETVAYTELLMALFAQQVTAPLDLDRGAGLDVSTVGQALAWAKNEYVSGLQTFSVYDEKAVMESTFYGLPFYRVGLDSEPLPDPPNNQVENGELVVDIDTDFTQPEQTPSGTLFVDALAGRDSLIVAPGRPIQPKSVVDVSDVDPLDTRRLASVAHGAIIESMTSVYDNGVDPVIAAPIFDESASQPEPDVGDVVFPTRPLDITTSVGAAGKRQQLVVATGQFNSERNTQRLDDEHRISVYYSNSDDFTPPAIGAVTSAVAGGVLSIDVAVSDLESDVERVVALVAQNPGFGTVRWSVLPLADSSGRWSGTLALERQTTDVEFIIQALDEAGNVGFASNKAKNFGDVTSGGGPLTPPVGGDLDVQVPEATGPVPGVFAGSVSITVSGSAAPIEYSVNGGPLEELPASGSFTISEPGLNTWRVVTGAGQSTAGVVEIDTDGAPDIEIRTPAEGAVLPADTPRRFDAICMDDTRDRCVLTLTGPIVDGVGPARTVANGSTLPRTPGAYMLSVRGTDRLGNEDTMMRSFTIARTVGAPTIQAITGPAEPQRIDVPVEIVTTFVDPSGTSDNYELIVDWGDETASEVIAVDPGSEPTTSLAATVPASHVYGEPGVYSIEVTVSDKADGEAVATYEFVVVFDPDKRARVSGNGFYWSGPEAHSGSPWFGSPAFFGYNARYRNGADVPSGKTKLRLVGEFFFRSTEYDYLIVNDTLAVAEGIGTTGGNTSYRFRVQGIDNGRVDFFQISIWDDSTGDVLYDNGVVYTTDGLVGDDRGDRVLLGGIRVRS